jgi:hypothetical protein
VLVCQASGPHLPRSQVSAEGNVLRTLMDPNGSHVSHTSAVTAHGEQLFIGNLAKPYVSMLNLAACQAP